jgi:hypothetical protein
VTYGDYSYAIRVLRPDGTTEMMQTHIGARPITDDQVLAIPLFGDIKITKIFKEAAAGRAGEADAVRVPDRGLRKPS